MLGGGARAVLVSYSISHASRSAEGEALCRGLGCPQILPILLAAEGGETSRQRIKEHSISPTCLDTHLSELIQ